MSRTIQISDLGPDYDLAQPASIRVEVYGDGSAWSYWPEMEISGHSDGGDGVDPVDDAVANLKDVAADTHEELRDSEEPLGALLSAQLAALEAAIAGEKAPA